MNCPVCGSKSVGKVGVAQYYCWNCFLVYQYFGDNIKVFMIEEDGKLVDYESASIV